MTIYVSSRVLPYVYKITHKETGQFYIGYREANIEPSTEDFGKNYFTSSVSVKELGFTNFDTQIIAEFFTGADAWRFEQELIKERFSDPLILNRRYYNPDATEFRTAGRPLSEEHRANIKAFYQTEAGFQSRAKLSKLRKGKKQSPEQIEKIASYKRGKPLSELHKNRISDSMKNYETTDQHCANLSKAKSSEWILIHEDGGQDETIQHIKSWCLENNIKYTTILHTVGSNRYHKGYRLARSSS